MVLNIILGIALLGCIAWNLFLMKVVRKAKRVIDSFKEADEIKNFEKKSFDGKTLEGAILSSRSKANAGDNVEITVNPGTGKQLQEGSLKAIYTNSLGKKITYTIPKNTSGKYFLTMPELIKYVFFADLLFAF